jgi:UDP-N-acetylmuramoyl-tripeptide--D-alanyl-D-alanine ligase
MGKMHELGASSQTHHEEIGTLTTELGIDNLVCIGAPEYARSITADSQTAVHLFAKKIEAQALVDQMSEGDVVLVKASRAERLEDLAIEIERIWMARNVTEEGER